MRPETVLGYFWLRKAGVPFSRIIECTGLTSDQITHIETCKQPKEPYCLRQMTETCLRWEHRVKEQIHEN